MNKSNYPTCKSCRFWDNRFSGPQYTCLNYKLNEEDALDGALGGEPADWTGISTGPDFGCIHHEPKDQYIYLKRGDYPQQGDEVQNPETLEWVPVKSFNQKIDHDLGVRRKI